MAWNPKPEVAVARDAAAKLQANQVVIVFIRNDGRFGVASYGRTMALCGEAGALAERLYDATMKYYGDE